MGPKRPFLFLICLRHYLSKFNEGGSKKFLKKHPHFIRYGILHRSHLLANGVKYGDNEGKGVPNTNFHIDDIPFLTFKLKINEGECLGKVVT